MTNLDGDMQNLSNGSMNEMHWLMEMLHHIDVGIVVLDKDYKVQIFNSFMENHSGLLPRQVKGELLFDLFEEIPQRWFKRKVESVFLLKNKAFTTWENRPYIFKFESYRPITSQADYMYQDSTFMPLVSSTGEVSHLCLLIYDVTDTALNKLSLEKANQALLLGNQIDGLTSLFNREHWEKSVLLAYQQWLESNQCSVLILIDVNKLSDINALYGYGAGDAVLVNLAKTIQNHSENTGVCGRYAGSQFGIVLQQTNIDTATQFALRLRESVKQEEVTLDGTVFSYAVNIGIAIIDEHVTQYQHWLRFASNALSLSKKSSENEVIVNDNSPQKR